MNLNRISVWTLCAIGLVAGLASAQENIALNKVVIRTKEILPVIRGASLDQPDPIDVTRKTVSSDRPAIEIICVGDAPGASDYEAGKDFSGFNNWAIQWIAGGRHPAAGAAYYVACKYAASEKGHNTSAHGGHLTDGTRRLWRARAPSWIYVDLLEEKIIGRVVVRQEAGTNYFSGKLVAQIAKPGASNLNDDQSWETVVALDKGPGNPLEQATDAVIDFKIQPVKSRYVRLVVAEGRPADNYAYITELELYAP